MLTDDQIDAIIACVVNSTYNGELEYDEAMQQIKRYLESIEPKPTYPKGFKIPLNTTADHTFGLLEGPSIITLGHRDTTDENMGEVRFTAIGNDAEPTQKGIKQDPREEKGLGWP